MSSSISNLRNSPSIQAFRDTTQALKTGFTALAKEGLNQVSGQLKSYKDESKNIKSPAGKVAHFAVTALIRAPLWAIGGLLKAPGIGVTTLATLVIGTPCHYLTMLLQKSNHQTAANRLEMLGNLVIGLVGIGPTLVTMVASLGQTLGTTNFRQQRDFNESFNRAFQQSFCLSNIFHAQALSHDTEGVREEINELLSQIRSQNSYDTQTDKPPFARPKTDLDGITAMMFAKELVAYCSNQTNRNDIKAHIEKNLQLFDSKIPGVRDQFAQAFEEQYN